MLINSLNNKKKYELKKHVGSIQCSNPLSLVQRKISNALLYNAYDELLAKDEHVIEIRHLCNLIDYDSNDHKLIKTSLKKLLSTIIEWNLLNVESNAKDTWTASSMLASVSIQGALCTYSYSSHLKKLLYTPSMYGRVDLSIQAKFKSSYALALYENCNRYQNLPYSGWFSIDIFRKLMGVGEDKYKVFRDFKRRIIDKAVEEVNKYSDLTVVPEMRREQRKVSSIRFKIDKKAPNIMVEKKKTLYSQLMDDWGLTTIQIQKIEKAYDEIYIKEKMGVILRSNSFKTNKIKNRAAYLMSALLKDYKVNDIADIKSIDSKKYKDYEEAVDIKQNQATEIYQQLCDYLGSQDKHKAIELEFEQYLCKKHARFLWQYFKKDGFSHKAIRSEFVQYIKYHYEALYEDFYDIIRYK